jgi:hypothetical protein
VRQLHRFGSRWCFSNFAVGGNWSDGEEARCPAANLTGVGQAAYEVLKKRHHRQHHKLEMSPGTVVGEPSITFSSFKVHDPDPGHLTTSIKWQNRLWTERWWHVMSLGPPDGLFMEKFQEALTTIWKAHC